MTEASPVCARQPVRTPARRTGTIGVPFPQHPDEGGRRSTTRPVEVPQGERGELLIKGPQVFQGYWNNPEETAKTLTADGWLRTGDVVTVDADGFTTVVDRVKELIITGGFNVSPHRGGGRAATAPGRPGRRRRRQAAGARRRTGGGRRRT